MQQKDIIFFDSQCKLCNHFVNFVFKRDTKRHFQYAPLQGQIAKQLLKKTDIEKLNSIILLHKEQVLKEAPAIQNIMSLLYPLWSVLFFTIPSGFFNFFYKFIAKKRYTFFGKNKKLYQPSEEQKKHFLP